MQASQKAWLSGHTLRVRLLQLEQRLYSLDARRETPFYSDRERAALAWTEAVTRITEGHVPDEVFEQVRARFSEKRSLI